MPARACNTYCREEIATTLLCFPLSLSFSLSQATQQPSRSDTHLKLDRLNLGFRMLSFITHMWSSTQSVRYLTWPCLQLGALAGGLAACSWAHHPFQVRGWLGILKLNVSLDVMAMKPSTINSKLCTIATNQPFPQVLWLARGSHLCGHWGAPNESSFVSVCGMFFFLPGLKNCRSDVMWWFGFFSLQAIREIHFLWWQATKSRAVFDSSAAERSYSTAFENKAEGIWEQT